MNLLPKDPMILLSFINTQLRDNYDSLEELCESLDADMEAVNSALEAVGFSYDRERNCFR